MDKRESLDSLALHAWAATASDGVVIADRAGRVKLINVSAQQFLLLDCMPDTIDDLLACADSSAPGMRAMLSRDFTSEAPRWGSVRVPQFPTRMLTWERVPLYSLGVVSGVLLVIKAPSLASPVERANQSFLSMISHDLRTPLSAILGFAELLRQNKDTLTADEQTEFLDHIIKNASDLNQYTQIALDIMYLEANLQQFEIEAVSLHRFIEHWMMDARHRFPEARLIYRDGNADETMASISPSALHRILYILIEFALQESPPTDPVEICLDYDDTSARVLILLNAPNLKASEVASLFELMTGRDLSYLGRPNLHRMQLYVASLLAERQQGSLALHGKGSCQYEIELILPRSVEEG